MSRRVYRYFILAAIVVTSMALSLPYLSLFRTGRVLVAESTAWPREYHIGSPAATPLTYLVLGDSTAVGAGASRLEDTYPYHIAATLAQDRYVHVVNVAETGARMVDILHTQFPKIAAHKPDILSVSVGANDATHTTSSKVFEQTTANLVTALSAQSAPVFFANTPNMGYVPALPWPFRQWVDRRARQQNVALEIALARAPKIMVVDLYYEGQLNVKENPAYYAADQFHPADAGYRKWAKVFTSALAK